MKPGSRLPSVGELKKKYSLSQATIDKAYSILAKKGYISSARGKGTFVKTTEAIEQGSNGLIGLIIPRVYGSILGNIAESIEQNLSRKGKYHTILCNSYENPAKEGEYIKDLIQKDVSAIVLFPGHRIESVSNVSFLLRASIPSIILCEIAGTDADVIEDDKVLGGYLATSHLIELGNRDIAFIAGKFDVAFPFRFAGYRKALAEYSLKYDPALVKVTPYNRSVDVKNMLKELLVVKKKPSAIFGINDQTAIEIIEYLLEAGIKVPDDIAVVGYDNLHNCGTSRIPITTVATPIEKIGKKVAALIDRKIISKDFSSGKIKTKFKPQLIVRDSCGSKLKEKYESSCFVG
ncbi:MAG: GntR family transcriptional regulator [Victivallaceae bacterium]|nr:GntR family transcriptional regulator [Victivallaceae bacterium]